jgi:hypothetical protein
MKGTDVCRPGAEFRERLAGRQTGPTIGAPYRSRYVLLTLASPVKLPQTGNLKANRLPLSSSTKYEKNIA